MVSGDVYALMAGLLGAVASSAAKLSLGADYLKDMCDTGMESWTRGDRPWTRGDRPWTLREGEKTPCDWVTLRQLHIPLRLLCGGLLFTCNAVMWTLFSRALRRCPSSARATVTTAASNFVCSAVLGRLIFGETHAALWWVGISLTLSGLLVLHRSAPQTASQDHSKKDT